MANEAIFHKIFGGWVSSLLDKAETHSRKKLLKQSGEEIRRSLKKRAPQRKRKKKKTPRKLTKKPIIFSDHDEDEYVNNYGDETMKESVVIDLEKLDKKIQDGISHGLIYTLAGFGVLFMIVYPVLSFFYMIRVTDNRNVCVDVCCLKDPSYKLVKKMCKAEDVVKPTYARYIKLKKLYRKELRTLDEEEEKVQKIQPVDLSQNTVKKG